MEADCKQIIIVSLSIIAAIMWNYWGPAHSILGVFTNFILKHTDKATIIIEINISQLETDVSIDYDPLKNRELTTAHLSKLRD